MMKIEFDDVTVAYALPPKADIRGRVWRVCQVPIADMAVMSAMCARPQRAPKEPLSWDSTTPRPGYWDHVSGPPRRLLETCN